MKNCALLLAIWFALHWAPESEAHEVPGCGSLQNAYGPFDYRDPVARRDSLPVVETHHFSHDVESLVRGKTGTVLGDIGYTLRAFPNHPRALRAVGEYALRGGRFPQDDAIPSADCYFYRALAFRPDDESAHVIFGNFLYKRGDLPEAREQYEEALRLAPTSVDISYAAGLFFLADGDLDRAKKLAEFAYDNGYPLPGLRDKIAAAESASGSK